MSSARTRSRSSDQESTAGESVRSHPTSLGGDAVEIELVEDVAQLEGVGLAGRGGGGAGSDALNTSVDSRAAFKGTSDFPDLHLADLLRWVLLSFRHLRVLCVHDCGRDGHHHPLGGCFRFGVDRQGLLSYDPCMRGHLPRCATVGTKGGDVVVGGSRGRGGALPAGALDPLFRGPGAFSPLRLVVSIPKCLREIETCAPPSLRSLTLGGMRAVDADAPLLRVLAGRGAAPA